MQSEDVRTDRSSRPWKRPPWYELLPEALLLGGLAWFAIDEPTAALSGLTSGRALVLTALAVVVWVAARLAMARWVRWRLARMALFTLAALGALAVVVLPAYRSTRVVEAFPGPAATVVAAPAAPVSLRTGELMGIDHRATGTASTYRLADGRHVIGLEAFDIQPGPNYDVYVVPGSDREARDGGIKLDDLRGNEGTQYYEVPSGVDVTSGPWTLLIWCDTFGVPVANATPV